MALTATNVSTLYRVPGWWSPQTWQANFFQVIRLQQKIDLFKQLLKNIILYVSFYSTSIVWQPGIGLASHSGVAIHDRPTTPSRKSGRVVTPPTPLPGLTPMAYEKALLNAS